MPELPEVEAIAHRASLHSIGRTICRIEILRDNGKYFYGTDVVNPDQIIGRRIEDVCRYGKYVLFRLDSGQYIQSHNAMSGYWDWEHDPWTFDYVEGPRSPGKHVRIKIHLSDGGVLRFNDTRLFGRIALVSRPPEDTGWELLRTPMGRLKPVISDRWFADHLWSTSKPIKHVLMDQSWLAGIGNIYSNESCHLAGIDPSWPACSVPRSQVPILLEALRCTVGASIPQVRYDWLRVYRRQWCGTCAGPVHRELLLGRATFSCPRCQWEP